MSEPKPKKENATWKALKRGGALASLSLLAWIGKQLSRFGRMGEDLRCWALEKRDGVR